MRKVIALDANLLVLLVVGLTERRYISIHKRLKEYDVADFDQLNALISHSAGIAATPNALSEASNLLRQIGEPAKTQIAVAFRELIKVTSEIHIKSVDAASRTEFLRIGLSDSALLEIGRSMEISKKNMVILSVDLDLYLAACAAGYEAINFNHVRDAFSR
jgi:hypothetical protein